MSDTNKYAEELKIDPEMLDVEWLKQPQYFFKYSEKSAEAQRDYNKAKEKVEVCRAILASSIRKYPADYGIEKVTEGSLSEALSMCLKENEDEIRTAVLDYREAIETLNDIKFDADILQSAVRAFEQRKTALENLVKLHGASYFSSPSAPRELKKTMGEIEREGVNKQIRRRLNSSE